MKAQPMIRAHVSLAVILVACVVSVLAGQQARRPAGPGAAPSAETARRVAAGAVLYQKKGCYECHVNEAQGGPQGPRLGPNPIPLPRFTTYVRNPSGEMPPFSERVLPKQDLEDIYAFLQARPQPKPLTSLPLLAP